MQRLTPYKQAAVAMTLLLFSFGGAGAASAAQRASGQPCQEIIAACQKAGFVAGGVNKGSGLQLNCVQPIMQGTTVTGSEKPLPQVDPQTVAACKQRNPRFGQANLA
jgi:hypothetical protein